MESYLNNNYYGNRSYGVAAAAQSYWKKDLKDLTLAQYALLAGIPQVAHATTTSSRTPSRRSTRTRRARSRPAWSSRRTPQVVRRRNQILELMKTRSDLTGRHVHGRRLRGRQGRARDPRRAGRRRVARPALRVAGPQGARRDPVRRAPVREDRHRRLQGDHVARLQDAAHRREVGLRGGDHPQQQEPGQAAQGAPDPAQRVVVDQEPARPQHPQRGRGRRRLPHRRDPRLRRLGVVHGQGQQEDAAPVRRPRPTAGASRDRRSSRSSTSSASTTRR